MLEPQSLPELTLTLTLPTLTLALFRQTLLYWSDCLMLALRHLNHSFDLTSANPNLDPPNPNLDCPNPNLDPPLSNLGPLQSNLTLLVGLSHACFETLEPQL